MHTLSWAFTGLAEASRDFQVLQVGQLGLQILLHLSEELGECAFGQSLDDVLLLVEVKWLLAHAELASQTLVIHFRLFSINVIALL